MCVCMCECVCECVLVCFLFCAILLLIVFAPFSFSFVYLSHTKTFRLSFKFGFENWQKCWKFTKLYLKIANVTQFLFFFVFPKQFQNLHFTVFVCYRKSCKPITKEIIEETMEIYYLSNSSSIFSKDSN